MYKQILVPVGRREESQQVLDTAVELAELFGATVHLFQAVDVQIQADPGSDMMELFELEKQRGEERLKEFSTRFLDRDLDVQTRVTVDYSPAERILDYLEENDIELVIMASQTRTGVPRLFLGSTTERVLRETGNTPVLVVPINEENAETDDAADDEE